MHKPGFRCWTSPFDILNNTEVPECCRLRGLIDLALDLSYNRGSPCSFLYWYTLLTAKGILLNIDHMLCDYRRLAVRPQQRRVLGGGVGHGHPGGVVLEFFYLREALSKESRNVLGRSHEAGIVQFLCKGTHGFLILLQGKSQLRQHRQCAKQGFVLCVFRV